MTIFNPNRISNPRFLLTGYGEPDKGQESIVYEALKRFQEEQTLVELAQGCIDRGYEDKIQEKPVSGTFLLSSILFHLRTMLAKGMVKEV